MKYKSKGGVERGLNVVAGSDNDADYAPSPPSPASSLSDRKRVTPVHSESGDRWGQFNTPSLGVEAREASAAAAAGAAAGAAERATVREAQMASARANAKAKAEAEAAKARTRAKTEEGERERTSAATTTATAGRGRSLSSRRRAARSTRPRRTHPSPPHPPPKTLPLLPGAVSCAPYASASTAPSAERTRKRTLTS